jgi:hypothetical protein
LIGFDPCQISQNQANLDKTSLFACDAIGFINFDVLDIFGLRRQASVDEDVLQQFASENRLVGGVAYIKARNLKNNTSHHVCQNLSRAPGR